MWNYYYAPGTISLAPHIVLHELGATFNPVRVAVADNIWRNYATPEFLKISPDGLVPVLDTGEFVLTESLAISLHLAYRKKIPDLIPALETLEGAKSLEYLSWLVTQAHRVIGAYFRPEHLTEDRTLHASLHQSASRQMGALALYIESRLPSQSNYATGATFTLVDAFLLVYHRWVQTCGVNMHHLPNWKRITRNALRREAVCKALATEGITLEM